MTANFPFFVVGLLFLMGLIAVIVENNLIKIAIGVSLMESAANLFLVALGYRFEGDIPIHFLPGPVDMYVLPPNATIGVQIAPKRGTASIKAGR